MLKKVLDAVSSNGPSSTVEHPGGEAEMIVTGTFNGAKVTVEAYYPQVGEWVPLDQGSYPAVWEQPLIKRLTLRHGCELRLVVSDASASTSISGWI